MLDDGRGFDQYKAAAQPATSSRLSSILIECQVTNVQIHKFVINCCLRWVNSALVACIRPYDKPINPFFWMMDWTVLRVFIVRECWCSLDSIDGCWYPYNGSDGFVVWQNHCSMGHRHRRRGHGTVSVWVDILQRMRNTTLVIFLRYGRVLCVGVHIGVITISTLQWRRTLQRILNEIFMNVFAVCFELFEHRTMYIYEYLETNESFCKFIWTPTLNPLNPITSTSPSPQ